MSLSVRASIVCECARHCSLVFSDSFTSRSYLSPAHYPLLYFLHRSRSSSCSMSQSKAAITLKALPNENTNTTITWICLPPYAVIFISFGCSLYESPLNLCLNVCPPFFLPLHLTSFSFSLSPLPRSPLFALFLFPLSVSCSSPSCQRRCR